MPLSSRVLFIACFSLTAIAAGFAAAGISGATWPIFVGVSVLVVAIILGIIAFCKALSHDDKVNQAEKNPPKAH